MRIATHSVTILRDGKSVVVINHTARFYWPQNGGSIINFLNVHVKPKCVRRAHAFLFRRTDFEGLLLNLGTQLLLKLDHFVQVTRGFLNILMSL